MTLSNDFPEQVGEQCKREFSNFVIPVATRTDEYKHIKTEGMIKGKIEQV